MKIIYTKNNQTHIVMPTLDGLKALGILGIIKKDVPEDAKDIAVISDDALPKDRYFRSAWKPCNKNGIKICKKTAKGMHLDNLRSKRDKILEELDKHQLRVLADKEALESIEVGKQVLRDLPIKILSEMEDMDDLEVIKNYIPKELK